MTNDESLIQASSVNIGAHSTKNASELSKELKPWALLVYGDFGFSSAHPEKVSSGTIQDFIQTCGVEIKGSVDTNLPETIEPFTVSTAVKAFSDFSEEVLLQKAPVMKGFFEARDILKLVSSQKMPVGEARSRIVALALPQSVTTPVLTALTAEPPRVQRSTQSALAQGSFADSIMSMMDTGTKPAAPLDNLINAIGETENNPAYAPAQLTRAMNILDDIISRTAAAIRTSAHFSAISSSWYSLKNLLKKIGRNKLFDIYLYSAPETGAVDSFGKVLSFCNDTAITPDIILWSYDSCDLSLQSIEKLNVLAALADNVKSLLVASVSSDDPIVNALSSDSMTEELMQSESWNAYTCLRGENHSRALALCTPSFHINHTKDNMLAGGAWLLADHWISTFLQTNTPFNTASVNTTDFHDDQLLIQIPPHRVKETAATGITFVRTKAGRIIISPRVVFDAGDNELFSLFGFNLLVNKTIRLSGDYLLFGESKMPIDQAAKSLQKYLFTQLEPYGILTPSLSALRVEPENENLLSVTIDSQSCIEGNAAQLEFSFEY